TDGRGNGNVVPMKPGANQMRPASTKAMRAQNAGKPKEKNTVSMPAVIGVVAIALTVGLGSVMMAGGPSDAGTRSGVAAKASATRTAPPMPGGLPLDAALPSNQIEKLPKDIKELIDKGD